MRHEDGGMLCVAVCAAYFVDDARLANLKKIACRINIWENLFEQGAEFFKFVPVNERIIKIRDGLTLNHAAHVRNDFLLFGFCKIHFDADLIASLFCT